MSGSPAEQGGIKSGDVITRLDGKAIENSTMLRNRLADAGGAR